MEEPTREQIDKLIDALNEIAEITPTSAETTATDSLSRPGARGGLPLDQFVDANIGRILGARPGNDPNRIVSLLTGAFEVKKDGANNSYYGWRPQGTKPVDGATDGQIAGAQATLYQEVLVIQSSANRLLDTLEPITLDPDQDEIDEAKERIRNSLAEIVSEFGRSGGAVLDRIAVLNETLNADLVDLQSSLGLLDNNDPDLKVVDVAKEEQIRTNFEILQAYIFRHDTPPGSSTPQSQLDRLIEKLQDTGNLKGTLLAQLLRTINAIPETLQVLYNVMDSVRFGAVDRRINRVDAADTTTFEQLFSWIETSASNDWPTALVGGGAKKTEILSIRLAAERQRDKIIRLIGRPDLSNLIGTGAKRVVAVLRELGRELGEVVSATTEITK